MVFCYHCFQCLCTTTSSSDGGVTTTTTTCGFSCCFDYIKARFSIRIRLSKLHYTISYEDYCSLIQTL